MSPAFDLVGIGLNATDTLILLKEFPPYAGKVPFDREMLSPGGQVATAVVTAATLGLRTKYIGTVGDDLRGDVQRDSLDGRGVDTSGIIVRRDCPNQTAYILIDERTGERTVLWHRSDALRLSASEINEDEIVASRWLHIDGYDTDAAAFAASIARQHRIPVSLDVDTVYPHFEKVLRHVDMLVAGSGWPAKWTGENDNCKALMQLQREYGMPVAAMTLGDEGAIAYNDGQWFYSAAYDVRCADTTGAGDVFHGAFCYAMLSGWPMEEVLQFSNAAAAINCTAIGARGHVPKKREVDALIEAAKAGRVKRKVSEELVQRLREQRAAAAVSS